jgi:hypothetical protein
MRSVLWSGVVLVACLAGARVAAASDPVSDIHGSGGATISAALGTAITYQGKLDKNGVPVNGTCNFTFKLYDAVSAGAQIGSTVTVNNQPVAGGFFTAALDFGSGAFDGQARWLEIQVQGPGDAGFTALTPRQPITAAPYALYALAGPVTGSQWTSDASGITHPGNIGIASPSSSGIKLHINGGTAENNALYAHNTSVDWATFVLRNFAPGGFGLYDDQSSKHYIAGRFGVGVVAPDGKLQANSSSEAAIIGKHTSNWVGVYGESQTSAGVWGNAITSGVGVQGTHNPTGAIGFLGHGNGWGVVGDNTAFATRGILGTQTDGVVGVVHSTTQIAGRFENDAVGGTALLANGVAKVKTLQILGGADLAERFESSEPAEPGTVMVIDARSPGRMRVSDEPYCRRVAGVVSGAQSLAAGVILDDDEHTEGELPIALTGRVWVKCEANQNPIHPGDLLTTSRHPGHAMAATDLVRSSGAILGKAMTSLEAGTGMVLVLVSLQ